MALLSQFDLSAPAKINLFLRIVGRRADGYHDMQTVFQLLDLVDTLSFSLLPDSGEVYVECEQLSIPQQQNLVYRAAKLLQDASPGSAGVNIRIKKRIPEGAGLGGGSSDAATALHGLNRLWHCGFSTDELILLGRELGADVPIFVRGISAWAEGVGDQLTPIHLPEDIYLLLSPDCQISTAEVFAHPDLTRDSTISTIARFLEQGPEYTEAENDCEAVVCAMYPEVREALEWLSGWGAAKMTGTGSCVFVKLSSQGVAREVLSQVPAKWSALIARGTQRSVLLQELDQIEGNRV